MNRGEKQVYGTQTLRMNGKQFPVPIENPDKVDTLRKEIGLEPMKEYMEDTGFDWSGKLSERTARNGEVLSVMV